MRVNMAICIENLKYREYYLVDAGLYSFILAFPIGKTKTFLVAANAENTSGKIVTKTTKKELINRWLWLIPSQRVYSALHRILVKKVKTEIEICINIAVLQINICYKITVECFTIKLKIIKVTIVFIFGK